MPSSRASSTASAGIAASAATPGCRCRRRPIPTRETPPPRDEIELPLRGKALRDRIVLRIIAIDRAIHFVVLAVLAVAVFLFAAHEIRVRDAFYRVVNAVQGGDGSPAHASGHGFLHSIEHIFTLKSSTLYASRRPPRRTPCSRASKRSGSGTRSAGRST